MAASSATLHESNLKPETVDRHRAIVSIMEELEAVDWYDQRAEAASDPELRAVLEHNRDEEKATDSQPKRRATNKARDSRIEVRG